MEPKVAILILNWNSRDETRECLVSLRKLNYRNHRVVVIDNGSGDGSKETLREEFPAVEIISSPENLGFSGGNNLGIKLALQGGADYVCLLNNDTVVDREFLPRLVAAAEADPGAGILGGRICFYHYPRLIWSEGIRVSPLTGRVTTPLYRSPEKKVGDEIRTWDAVSGAAALVKREVLERIGLLDPAFFIYYEDVDWCWRARQRGYRVVTVPRSLIWHKVSASLKRGTSEVIIYYLVRNQLLLMNKNFPLASPARRLREGLIIAFNLAYLLTTTRLNHRRSLKAFSRGVGDFYRGRFGQATF